MKKIDKNDFKYELLKSFHEQFAQNQNHHQNLFIQVVSILLTVIIGFGYTLFNFKSTGFSSTKSDIGLFEFTAAFTISEIILLLGIAIVSNMALGFRRDQFINARIRELAKITGDSADLPEDAVFAKSYNPMRNYYKKKYENNKNMFFEWMPNFHIIFSMCFLVIQTILLIIYFFKLDANNFLQYHVNNSFEPYSLFSVLGIVAIPISFKVISYFHKNLQSFFLTNGMQKLINNRYKHGPA